MRVIVLKECGFDEAMLGVSLSWASDVERSKQIAPNLAHRQGGHNKNLESICLWIDVSAPRYWWQEAPMYRVGNSMQSESTMHTITKNFLTQSNFEYPIYEETLKRLNNDILIYQTTKDKEIFLRIKANLPEGFLQRRIWSMNYKVLQNIYNQRYNHRLPQWRIFLDTVLSQIEHPEFIINQSKKE